VDGFQARFIATHLVTLAGLMALLSAGIFAKPVWLLLEGNSPQRLRVADEFLALHRVIWPLLGLFFLGAGVVSVFMTHRVAGPLYRFRRVFRDVGRGVLSMRVRTRDGDYLAAEARDLDEMVGSLRSRLSDVRDELSHAVAAVQRAEDAGHGTPELDAARVAVERAAWVLAGFDLSDAAGPAPRRDPAEGRVGSPITPTGREVGFTLVEVVLGLAIVAVLAAIATPAYTSALEAARVTRAIGDISAIDREVRLHLLDKGCLPSNLNAIGFASLRDPWGRTYVYGVLPAAGGGGGGRGGGGGGGGGCGACAGGCLTAGAARKDRRLVPINADFDLYSLGRDGKSAPALTAAVSQDDVVRGSDGGFVGLGKAY
jgi:general secretion pathway protein G